MAYTSPNMGLKIWNLITDLFSHSDLASNLATLDTHDHTPGKGVQLSSASLANQSVTGNKIASGTITLANLAPGVGRLAPRSVSSNATANDGDLILLAAGANNVTITLPAPLSGYMVGVVNPTTSSPFLTNTIAASSGLLRGPGLGTGVATLSNFGGNSAFMIFQGNGINWHLVAGQRDTGWVPAGLNGNTAGGAGSTVPGARAIGDVVYLRGTVISASSGPTIITVPSFATPPILRSVVGTYGSGGAVSTALMTVQVTGAVSLNSSKFVVAGSATFPTGDGITFDGISYSLTT